MTTNNTPSTFLLNASWLCHVCKIRLFIVSPCRHVSILDVCNKPSLLLLCFPSGPTAMSNNRSQDAVSAQERGINELDEILKNLGEFLTI